MPLLIEEEKLNLLPISGEEEHLIPLPFFSLPFLFSFPSLFHFSLICPPFNCILAFVPYTLKGSTFQFLWYYITTLIWYQGGVLEHVITSWSQYHTMCAHNWELHHVASTCSPFLPSVHTFYSDWGVSWLLFFHTYNTLTVLRIRSGTQYKFTHSTVTEGICSGSNRDLPKKNFPGWNNAWKCPCMHPFIPQASPTQLNNALLRHMLYVCFSYIKFSEIVLFCWVWNSDSSLTAVTVKTKLPETLLLWDMTLPVTVCYNCAPLVMSCAVSTGCVTP